nr:PLP-dependent aminotransferase family protein [Agrobacterium sp. S2/73]
MQARIREMLLDAIVSGRLEPGAAIPSSRMMAARLNVSRNTVTLAYHALLAGGFLVSRERSGFYVAEGTARNIAPVSHQMTGGRAPDWKEKLTSFPSAFQIITRPADWYRYPFPFVYGQLDPELFPIVAWRDCVRQSMSKKWQNSWTDDLYTGDDLLLVEQIRSKILARRGIYVKPNEILVTLGSQNALYLASRLLVKPGASVAMENPGYYAARNIFELVGGDIHPVAIDEDGLNPDHLGDARLVFVTPNHQFPTNVALSLKRRHSLMQWAHKNDGLIIEDDYESEINFSGHETVPLKALDTHGRVVYIGSLSKSLMPGLRVGFAVAHPSLIEEMRSMRGLVMRHPPSNNQRAVAFFLSLGHHDTFMTRLQRAYAMRWRTLERALGNFLPGWNQQAIFGGSSFWLRGPEGFSATFLAKIALDHGVVIEAGRSLFWKEPQADRFFRLGFSSISEERIGPGIERLAEIVTSKTVAG